MAAEPEPTLGAMNAILRTSTAPEEVRADFAAFLRGQGVGEADLEAMLAVGAERFLVYRQLVHNRLRNTIRDFVPRTLARLGKARYRADLTAWMDQEAPESPYLRDVPAEFVEWVVPRWREDPEVPSYLADLARHELLHLDVRNDPRGGEAPTGRPLALDRPLRFDGTARLMQYEHAVHRLPLDEDDRTEPEAIATRLFVYRDADGKPRYLELTPFAAEVLDGLLVQGLAVEAALRRACGNADGPLDDERLGTAATLLADLAERGALLGAD